MTAISDSGNSYEYQNLVRDMREPIAMMQPSAPLFLSLVSLGTATTSKKVEWLEDTLSQTQTTVASDAGTGATIAVTSASGLRAGSILRFETAAKASIEEQAQITSISGNTLTVTRLYGGTSQASLPTGTLVKLVASPLGENSTAVPSDNTEAEVAYNYTQIFERTASVSRTTQAIKHYGVNDPMGREVTHKLSQIYREINTSIIHGQRVERSAPAQGTLGGIYAMMSGGAEESTGGAVSKTHLNNLLEVMFTNGAFSDRCAFLMAPNQSRRISQFNTAGANPLTMTTRDDRTAGERIMKFEGDLAVQSGFTATIVVDPNVPADKIALVDLNNVEFSWVQNSHLRDMDKTGFLAGF
jgi:hypothetical protein